MTLNEIYFDVKFSTRYEQVALKAVAKPTRVMNLFKKPKRRVIDTENAVFYPLDSVGTGGNGPSASNALKQLASVLSAQKKVLSALRLINRNVMQTLQ